jgi:hypothetical protein
MLQLIETSDVPVNMVGLLFALPGTQLTRRLHREGRLDAGFDVAPDGSGDQCSAGLNFQTRRPRAEILRHYRRVLAESYSPKAYLGRVLRVGAAMNCDGKQLALPWRTRVRELRGFARLVWRMGVCAPYWPRFWLTLSGLLWKNPRSVRYTVALMALYLHLGEFARDLVRRLDSEISIADLTSQTDGAPAAASSA